MNPVRNETKRDARALVVDRSPCFAARLIPLLLSLLTACAPNPKVLEPARLSEPHSTSSSQSSPNARVMHPLQRDDSEAESPQDDPLAYLRRVAAETDELTSYTVHLTRFERRGWLSRMFGPEFIDCWFRQEPFSVRFYWRNEDLKYGESVYIAGRYDDQIRFVPRIWFPPLRRGINEVDLRTPVLLGETLNPVTDFGLRRLMERTLATFARFGRRAEVTFRGRVAHPLSEEPMYWLHIEVPHDAHPQPIQDLYIDPATHLPAGTIIRRPDGVIHAAYYYSDLDRNVVLTDEDFLLEYERSRTPIDQDGAASSATE